MNDPIGSAYSASGASPPLSDAGQSKRLSLREQGVARQNATYHRKLYVFWLECDLRDAKANLDEAQKAYDDAAEHAAKATR